MKFLRHLLILEFHPRKRKIAVPHSKSKSKYIVYLLKQRMMHYLGIGQKTCHCTKAIKGHAQSVVDILSIQRLEYEIGRADLPDDYFFLR